MTTYAVVGSRDFNDYKLLKDTLDSIKDIKLIVSGGARGADSFAERYAREKDIPLTVHLPDWNKYGRSAGFVRNKLIVDDADEVIAFWNGVSRGTLDSINYAHKNKKHVTIIKF